VPNQPRSRAGLWCAITAVGLLATAPGVAVAFTSAALFWVLLLIGFVVGAVAVGITAIELLAGYRGRPQTASLIIACVAGSALILFFAWLAAGGQGT
jgi:hypothetical protein